MECVSLYHLIKVNRMEKQSAPNRIETHRISFGSYILYCQNQWKKKQQIKDFLSKLNVFLFGSISNGLLQIYHNNIGTCDRWNRKIPKKIILQSTQQRGWILVRNFHVFLLHANKFLRIFVIWSWAANWFFPIQVTLPIYEKKIKLRRK